MSDSLSATADAELVGIVPEERTAAWPAVFALSLGVFALVSAEFLPASVLTSIAADLSISVGAAGQTVTVTSLVGVAAAIFTPIVTSRFDRRLVLWALLSLLALQPLVLPAHEVGILARQLWQRRGLACRQCRVERRQVTDQHLA